MADTIDAERFDPTSLVGRWAAGTLALAGALLVLLPSAQFGWDPIKGGWAARPALWVADLAAAIGLGVAFAIAWSRDAHRAAPLLGAAFGAAATAWGLRSADVVVEVGPGAARGLHVAQLLAWMFAIAMFSAFCNRFPRQVMASDFLAMQRRLAAGHAGSGLPPSEDPFSAMEAPFSAFDRWIDRHLGGCRRAMQRWAERRGLGSRPDRKPEWAQRIDGFAQTWLFRDAWLVVLALMPVVATVAILGQPKHAALPFALTTMVGVTSCFVLRFLLVDASPEERRRVLWIATGIVAAFMVSQLGFFAFMLGALLGHHALGLGLLAVSVPLAVLSLVLGLAMAVFGSGALDPGLAIKRSLVSGIVATLLTFTFALVEAFVATFMAEQLGLPTAAAPAVASAAVAVALGPMWKKVSGWVGGKLGAVAPASPSTEPAA